MLPSPISVDLAELIAHRFRVIGDPTRIRLLDALRRREHSVGELALLLDTSQQNASKHLGVLMQAGMLSRRKEGTSTRYRISDETVFALCEQVCGALQSQLDELRAVISTEPAAAG